MSKLLMSESPLLVYPTLACKVGLSESIILQQIHYWIGINEKQNQNKRDEYYWTYNSYEQWQKQFPFWHINTIKNAITNLEKSGLIVSGDYNSLKIDRTKWYRIDHKVLEALENSPLDKICTTNAQKWYEHRTKIIPPLPETTPEINSEISEKIGNFPKEKSVYMSFNDFLKKTNIKGYEIHVDIVRYYLKKYKQNKRKEHPNCTWQEWNDVIINIFSNDIIDDLDDYEENEQIMHDVINRHFQKKFKQYNHDIRNFYKFINNDIYEAGVI
jgi:hypothetical protein